MNGRTVCPGQMTTAGAPRAERQTGSPEHMSRTSTVSPGAKRAALTTFQVEPDCATCAQPDQASQTLSHRHFWSEGSGPGAAAAEPTGAAVLGRSPLHAAAAMRTMA